MGWNHQLDRVSVPMGWKPDTETYERRTHRVRNASRKASFLFLDEATSALDNTSEKMIQQTIDTWFSNASLGGGNSNYVFFTPNLGEDEPILTRIFFKRVETTNQIKSSEHGIGGGGGGIRPWVYGIYAFYKGLDDM